MKAVVAAFNQEKALVGAFSVIMNLRMELFEALQLTRHGDRPGEESPGEGRQQVVVDTGAARLLPHDRDGPGVAAEGLEFRAVNEPSAMFSTRRRP